MVFDGKGLGDTVESGSGEPLDSCSREREKSHKSFIGLETFLRSHLYEMHIASLWSGSQVREETLHSVLCGLAALFRVDLRILGSGE